MDPHPGKRTAALRVVVADEDLLVRTDLEALLSAQEDMTVVGLCAHVEELVADVARLQPDVVVTGARLQPTLTIEGVTAAGEIRRTFPTVGVVLLAQFLDPRHLLELTADDNGRRGYLLKEEAIMPRQLATAIRVVAAGGFYIDPPVVDVLLGSPTAKANPRLGQLTPRERATLPGIVSGKSNWEIGTALNVSHAAIKPHARSVLVKLGLPENLGTNRRTRAVIEFLLTQS